MQSKRHGRKGGVERESCRQTGRVEVRMSPGRSSATQEMFSPEGSGAPTLSTEKKGPGIQLSMACFLGVRGHPGGDLYSKRKCKVGARHSKSRGQRQRDENHI